MSNEALENYLEKLSEHLSMLKLIRYWNKYSNTRLFSEKKEGIFYEIKRYKNIIFYEIRPEGLFKLNLLKFLNKLLEGIEDEEMRNKFLNLKMQFQEFIVSIELLIKDVKPILNNVYNIPKFKSKIILVYTKEYNEEIFFDNPDQLEDFLDENLDKIEKIDIDNKIYTRPEILSQEYQEYEYNKLLENEEYELLDFITKTNKKYGK